MPTVSDCTSGGPLGRGRGQVEAGGEARGAHRVLDGSGRDDLARLQEQGVRRLRGKRVKLVRYRHRRQLRPRGERLLERVLEEQPPRQVEARGGLVEYEELRPRCQRSGEHDAGALAFGAGDKRTAGEFLRADTCQRLVCPRRPLRVCVLDHEYCPGEAGQHDVDHSLLRIEPACEERFDDPDFAADVGGRYSAESVTEHPNPAATRVKVRRRNANERRLPGAVRAEYDPVLAALDAPVDSTEEVSTTLRRMPPDAHPLQADRFQETEPTARLWSRMMAASADVAGTLDGLRVIDLGHALAGPFAATMLADHGADVLKIEHPERGDPMRKLGPRKGDIPVWWKAAGRNKRSVTLDFTAPRGKEILLRLVEQSDVLVENFRPGTLERHGLGWDDLRQVNPRLVMLRISGFGQYGPYASRPGFGRTAEAMSGAAALTGYPDGPPIHVGYSLADTLTGLMGAFGILLALYRRDRTDEGECIDLALYEPLFRLIDWQAVVYDQLGIAGTRAGNAFPVVLEGVAAGVAQTTDGVWLSYSAATDSVLERVVQLMVAERRLLEGRYATLEERRRGANEIQGVVSAWIATRTAEEVERLFGESHAVIGRVYGIEQIWDDPGFRARGNLVTVEDAEAGPVTMHGVFPQLASHPGAVRWAGPPLGKHTDEVLVELADVRPEELDVLRRKGVI